MKRVQKITKQHNQVILMNISTNRHFKVLIKISSYWYCNVFKNIQASNHRPPKWAALHMQLIMQDVAAQTTLGSLRFKANSQAFQYRRQLHEHSQQINYYT